MTAPSTGTVVRHSLLYSIGLWTGHLFAIISTPIYTRLFVPAEYGIVDYLTTLQAAMLLILPLGVDAGFIRYYSGTQDDAERREYLGTNFIFRSVIYVLACALFWLGSDWIAASIVGDVDTAPVVRVAVGSLFLLMMNEMVMDFLYINLRVKAATVSSVTYFVLRLSLIIFFVIGLQTGVSGIYLGTSAATFIVLIANLYAAREYLSLRFSLGHLREMVAFGIPLLPSNIAYYLLLYSDRYFLNYFEGFSSIGIYAIGDKVAYLSRLITSGFHRAWRPYVMNTWEQEGANESFRETFRLFSALLFVVATLVSIFSIEILYLFTTEEYLRAFMVIPFLIYSQFLYYTGLSFSLGIDISKKTYHRTWIGIVTMLLNPGLNLLLIPPFGIVGAALATFISYFFYGVVSLAVAERIYPMGFPIRRVYGLLLCGGLVIVGVYGVQSTDFSISQIAWKSIVALLVLGLPLLLGLITPQQVISAAKRIRAQVITRLGS